MCDLINFKDNRTNNANKLEESQRTNGEGTRKRTRNNEPRPRISSTESRRKDRFAYVSHKWENRSCSSGGKCNGEN